MPNEISRRTALAYARIFSAVFVVLLITTTLAFAHQPPASDKYSPEDRHALETYSLTADHLSKLIPAVKALQKLEVGDPSVEERLKHVPGETLEQMFKRIDSNAKVAAAVHVSGLSTKDYWMTGATVAMAYLVAENSASSASQSAMAALPWKPSADQIAFAKAHHAEIDQLMSIEQP